MQFKIEKHELKSFGDANPNPSINKRSNLLKTLKDVQDLAIAHYQNPEITEDDKKKPRYYKTMATVAYVPQKSLYYNSCKTEKCFKKVIQDGDGEWRCESCGGKFEEPAARFIAKVKLMDHTTSLYARLNSEKVGGLVLGKSAQEIREMCEGEYADEDILKNCL